MEYLNKIRFCKTKFTNNYQSFKRLLYQIVRLKHWTVDRAFLTLVTQIKQLPPKRHCETFGSIFLCFPSRSQMMVFGRFVCVAKVNRHYLIAWHGAATRAFPLHYGLSSEITIRHASDEIVTDRPRSMGYIKRSGWQKFTQMFLLSTAVFFFRNF